MEVFRSGQDIWGRSVLEGISWDLIGVAVIIGAIVIVSHALYRQWQRARLGDGRGGRR
jgi:hypothetical protein